jgi:hypothetical protein
VLDCLAVKPPHPSGPDFLHVAKEARVRRDELLCLPAIPFAFDELEQIAGNCCSQIRVGEGLPGGNFVLFKFCDFVHFTFPSFAVCF